MVSMRHSEYARWNFSLDNILPKYVAIDIECDLCHLNVIIEISVNVTCQCVTGGKSPNY